MRYCVLKEPEYNRVPMFYFAKSLQAAAMAVLLLGLYVGFKEEALQKEVTMLAIGVVLFLAGRLLERVRT